jgi:hypothetical protein
MNTTFLFGKRTQAIFQEKRAASSFLFKGEVPKQGPGPVKLPPLKKQE